jgi:hypothetical protein
MRIFSDRDIVSVGAVWLSTSACWSVMVIRCRRLDFTSFSSSAVRNLNKLKSLDPRTHTVLLFNVLLLIQLMDLHVLFAQNSRTEVLRALWALEGFIRGVDEKVALQGAVGGEKCTTQQAAEVLCPQMSAHVVLEHTVGHKRFVALRALVGFLSWGKCTQVECRRFFEDEELTRVRAQVLSKMTALLE